VIVGEDDPGPGSVRRCVDAQTLSRRPTDRAAGFAWMARGGLLEKVQTMSGIPIRHPPTFAEHL
jgi:hypothetical protein